MGRPVGRLIRCPQSSARQSARISFSKDLFYSSSQAQADSGLGPFTLEWQRTSDSPTLSARKQENRPRLNLGELVRSSKKPQILEAKTDILHRSRCCSYPPCLWWWYTSRWSGGFWQSMSIGSNVRTYQGLAEMAPEDQSWAKVRVYTPHVCRMLTMGQTLCYCVSHCCLFRSCPSPRPWPPNLPRP
jgi:hypothetical protein